MFGRLRSGGLRSNFIWNDLIFDSLQLVQTQRMKAIAELEDAASLDEHAINDAEEELARNNRTVGPFTGAYLPTIGVDLPDIETTGDEARPYEGGSTSASPPPRPSRDSASYLDPHAGSNYRLPRKLANLFIVFGWIAAILGALVAFIPPFVPGIALSVAGLFQILLCYIAIAVFDLADQASAKS